jgi:TRAP-type C4-dicarboxylate transport system permease small subunit
MGIGHVALGLALKKSEPRLNVGILVFATLLADFLLGVFAFLGWEWAHIPDTFTT